jgi:DNA-binding GntR family transcriptional regulator
MQPEQADSDMSLREFEVDSVPPRAQFLLRPEWLACVLRDRVLNGRYRPGQRIREAEIRQEFRVSNSPVREAFQQLVGDGLLTRTPGCGVRVVDLSRAEIIELFEVRLALIEYAAELAASRRIVDVLRRGEAMKDDLRRTFADLRAGNPATLQGQFLGWVMRAAGNARLEHVWRKTMLISRLYVYEAFRKSGARTIESLTLKLVDAIIVGDAPEARALAREMTRRTLLDLNGADLACERLRSLPARDERAPRIGPRGR